MKEKQKKDVGAVITVVVRTAMIKLNLFDAKTTTIIFSGKKKTFVVLKFLKN